MAVHFTLCRALFRVPGVLRGTRLLLFGLILALPPAMLGSGIFTDGQSARAMALGGASTADARGPLDALAANPAALSVIRAPTLDLGLQAAWAHGEFSNSANDHNTMNSSGVLGNGAFAMGLGPVTIGLGFIPDSVLRSDWRYRDAPGGADGGTTYGFRANDSEIELLRYALGASWQITPKLSFGGSVGLLYNRNRLNSPYILQSDPVLRSAKVLLDMQTEGWGWNGQFGLLWKPLDTLQLGLSYTLQSRIHSSGRAYVNANVQLDRLGLGAADPDANFDAEVTNTFPQIVSAGVAWRAVPKLNVIGQVDWVNWAGSFDTLEVRLTHPDNADFRALLLGQQVHDDVPLNWRDQFVFRFGLEYEINPHWTARIGYRYGRDPVPAETLTPLNAAIPEHVLGVGVGYRAGRFSTDLAYQWQFAHRQSVGASQLLSGEYSNSSTEVSEQWLALTTTIEF
jgi:long-chain fatty acid transport protein